MGRGVGGAALLACLLGGAGAWRAGVVDLQHLRLQRAFRPTRMVPSPPSMCSAGGGGGGGSEKGLRDMPGHLLLAPAATEEMSPSSSSGAEIELDCSEEDSWMGLKINDIPLTSDIAAIMLVYFVQGALGLGRLAIQFFLKDDLGLPPAQLAALTGLFALPWVFKPVYGFLSDGVPIGGYRRKSYLALSGMLGAAAWVYLSQVANAPAGATGACIASNLGIAVSDVVADSIVVEKARESRNPAVQSGLQSLCWGSSAVGGVLSAYFSGSLLEHLSVRQVFGLTSALPLLIASSALLVRERRLLEDTGTGDEKLVAGTVVTQAQLLWGAIRERSVWLPALFVFLWHATPSSDGAFFYFLTNDIGVGPEFLGRVRLGSSLASLVGVGVSLLLQPLCSAGCLDLFSYSTLVILAGISDIPAGCPSEQHYALVLFGVHPAWPHSTSAYLSRQSGYWHTRPGFHLWG